MKNDNHLDCNEKLLHQIQSNLKGFNIRTHEQNGSKRAAVAITVVDGGHGAGAYGLSSHKHWSNKAALILTRRASKLRKHPGQWAFPGGKMDPGEKPVDTALRELSEEVGLELGPDSVIGRMDDYTTRSGFTISPVVLWGGCVETLIPNPDEVESIHRIPIKEFLRNDAPILEDIPESQHPVLLMPVGHSWIASPTAAMIYQFREVAILGKKTRVAHFEQPYFAWS